MQTSPSIALLVVDGCYCDQCLSPNFPHERPLVRSCQARLSHCSMFSKWTWSFRSKVAVNHLFIWSKCSSGIHSCVLKIIWNSFRLLKCTKHQCLPSASEVKHYTPKVNKLPSVISLCSIRITYTGEWATILFSYYAVSIDWSLLCLCL